VAAPVASRHRLLASVLLGILAGHMALSSAYRGRPALPDILQFWYAARMLLAGHDPYLGIGPGRAFDYPFPMVYPLPAAVPFLPLAGLPAAWVCAGVMGTSVALFTWALLANGWPSLLAFASFCVWHAIGAGQWSPLLTASLVISPLAVLYACKPTLGAALWIAKPSWWAIGGGVVLLAIAFLLDPSWVPEWREALGRAMVRAHGQLPYHAPAMMPGGFLVLLALTRWRRWEARLLVALAVIPHTTLPYELVPLFLIPRGWKECASLVVLSYLLWWLVRWQAPTDFYSTVMAYTKAAVPTIYLPCTLMVLRRPNEGRLPTWLEARLLRWPPWIRGIPLEVP
jgi:hypothetical protein